MLAGGLQVVFAGPVAVAQVPAAPRRPCAVLLQAPLQRPVAVAHEPAAHLRARAVLLQSPLQRQPADAACLPAQLELWRLCVVPPQERLAPFPLCCFFVRMRCAWRLTSFRLASCQVERSMLRHSGLPFLLELYAVDRSSPLSSFLKNITPNNSNRRSPSSVGTKSLFAIGADLPGFYAHLLVASLSLLLRPSDAFCPAPNQIRLRIDHLVCGVLPELYQFRSRLRSGSSFCSEIDLPCSVEPALPEITLGLSPALHLLASFPPQFTELLGGSLGIGQGLGPLLGPIHLRIQGLLHRGLPCIHRFPPQLQRRCPTEPAQGVEPVRQQPLLRLRPGLHQVFSGVLVTHTSSPFIDHMYEIRRESFI